MQEDDVDDVSQNYLYHFNICNKLSESPPIVPPSSAVTCKNGSYSAYQITNNTRNGNTMKCRALGTADSLTWKLIETDNEGVVLQQNYSGGESGRFFVITLKCSKKPLEFLPVVELNTRQYFLTINSVTACPLECPIVNGMACGGNGVCGIDHDSSSIRCFCNGGKEGTSCSDDIVTTKSHANGVLMAFVIILLILLLILAGILYKKIKKLNSDATRYQTLQSEEKPTAAAAAPTNNNSNNNNNNNVKSAVSINEPPADVDD